MGLWTLAVGEPLFYRPLFYRPLFVGARRARSACRLPRKSRTQRGSPRNHAMTRETATPTSIQGPTSASVRTVPSAIEMSVLPVAVSALVASSAQKKRSGGLMTTLSKSRGLVYHAAAAQPTTKLPPASGLQSSQAEMRIPRKDSTNMPSSAPRAVSRAPER